MIYDYFRRYTASQPDTTFIATVDHEFTYRDILNLTDKLIGNLQAYGFDRTVIQLPNSPNLIGLLLANDALGKTVCPIRVDDESPRVQRVIDLLNADAVIESHKIPQFSVPCVQLAQLLDSNSIHQDLGPTSSGKIVILTTGSTGEPKGALHNWSGLTKSIKVTSDLRQKKWLLSYNLSHFAGLQLLLHAVCNGGTVVLPVTASPMDALDAICNYHVEYASGTPTFWRMLIGHLSPVEASKMSLRQITLGGEIVTSDLLDHLVKLFPAASISQIYATTETGPVFSVTDKRPGFPRQWLDKSHNGVEIRVREGELEVRSSFAMEGYINHPDSRQDGWHNTGDLVDVRSDRVYFLGRRSDMVNVGGVKVQPGEVEQIILSVPGVVATRVYGRPNPITWAASCCRYSALG